MCQAGGDGVESGGDRASSDADGEGSDEPMREGVTDVRESSRDHCSRDWLVCEPDAFMFEAGKDRSSPGGNALETSGFLVCRCGFGCKSDADGRKPGEDGCGPARNVEDPSDLVPDPTTPSASSPGICMSRAVMWRSRSPITHCQAQSCVPMADLCVTRAGLCVSLSGITLSRTRIDGGLIKAVADRGQSLSDSVWDVGDAVGPASWLGGYDSPPNVSHPGRPSALSRQPGIRDFAAEPNPPGAAHSIPAATMARLMRLWPRR